MPDDDAHAGVALYLGHFVSTMQWHDISETVQHDAKRALVNFFGSAIGAARHPDITALATVLETFSGPREATVIGRGACLDALSAATLNAVSPQHYARGWHITATCGVFGAAAAAAKLLRLSPEHTAHALSIAASQAAGVVENLPSGAKNIGVGHAEP